MKTNYYIITFALFLFFFNSYTKAQNIKWENIETVDNLIKNNKNNKLIFIDFYTNWCVYCKAMDEKTFSDKEIAKYMNDHFICIKFNAEAKENVSFNNKQYKWIEAGMSGVNTLAYYYLQGEMRYPSYVILDTNGDGLTRFGGFFQPKEFIEILKGFDTKIKNFKSSK